MYVRWTPVTIAALAGLREMFDGGLPTVYVANRSKPSVRPWASRQYVHPPQTLPSIVGLMDIDQLTVRSLPDPRTVVCWQCSVT